jgi:hypothetical protein
VSIDATPPRPMSFLDALRRPATAEIRPAPAQRASLEPFTLTYGVCKLPIRPDIDDNGDPPKMTRILVATSGTSPYPATNYNDCDRVASVNGLSYTVDIRVWDAESGGIIERLNHDYVYTGRPAPKRKLN